MKIKLQSNSKLQLVKAVMDILDIGLKKAKDLVDEQELKVNNEVYVTIDSEKTEEQIKAITEGYRVTYIPLSDTDFFEQNCNQTETVKIISDNSAGPLLDAVMKLCQVSPKEASEFIRKNIVFDQARKYVYVDVDMPRERIDAIASNIPDIEVQFIDKEQVDDNDADTTAPESANEQVVKQKLQEVADDDLGVSIHSIDEMSIGWQCKMLFTHEQAARVMAGLHDATFNVTETLVTHDGDKATMLVITKTFPTGTRKKDLEKFEKLIHIFIQTVCAVVSLEDALEGAKERAIEAFNELRDYE